MRMIPIGRILIRTWCAQGQERRAGPGVAEGDVQKAYKIEARKARWSASVGRVTAKASVDTRKGRIHQVEPPQDRAVA